MANKKYLTNKEKHRMLWETIADRLHNTKDAREIAFSLKADTIRALFPTDRDVENYSHCYACLESAKRYEIFLNSQDAEAQVKYLKNFKKREMCDFCPLIWGSEADRQNRKYIYCYSSNYGEYSNFNKTLYGEGNVEKAARIAEIIARKDWKEYGR